jgi:mannose-1-phosphate guanylyltransferase
MAGGSGTRFWPVSRLSKPKQFLDMADTGKTFIRHTYDRFCKIVPQENILIVTAEKFKNLVLEQIPELDNCNLLLEPYARNTAPCIAYATYKLLQRNPEAQIVVTPSDHEIDNEEVFADTVTKAFEYVAENDVLMTLGIIPTRPDTNYGYAQVCGGSAALHSKEPVKVKTFTEKPDKELAKVFLASGEFLWNAGMFLWKAETFRKEMEKHMPQVTGYFRGWEHALGTAVESEFITKAFSDCMNISLAYGVMEKTDRAWIYPVEFDWQDVGTWESLYNYMAAIRDRNGNAFSAGKVLAEDSKDMLVISPEKKKLIAIDGLEDYIIVDTDDVLLICPKDDKKFKDFISQIAMPEFEKYR